METHMKISLIHPSRGRPDKAHSTAKSWIENAGVETDYILSVDDNDSMLDIYSLIYLRSDMDGSFIAGSSTKLVRKNSSVVEATNRAAKETTGDILIYLSDDFKCFPNWGPAVIKEFEGVTEPQLIKVDDMLQPFHVPVLTIPIMNRALYERLGYFWHPEYKSMFVDEDLYWTAKKLGALKMCPHLKFEHQHVSVGKAQDDETYRNSAKNWDQGKALFAKRKAAGFPL